jgi:hypothetical protein
MSQKSLFLFYERNSIRSISVSTTQKLAHEAAVFNNIQAREITFKTVPKLCEGLFLVLVYLFMISLVLKFVVLVLLFWFRVFSANTDVFHVPSPCWKSWSIAMAERGPRSLLSWSTDQHFGYSAVVSDSDIKAKTKLNKIQNKSVLLVHVGKTCGTSVQKAFRKENIKHFPLHVHPMDHEMVAQFDYIVITLRDPYDRTISAYNFHDPKQVQTTGAPPVPHLKEFYGCFPTINDYGNQLLSNSSCGHLADVGIGHLTKNTCFYLCGVVDLLLKYKEKVHIIQTHSCEADTLEFLNFMGFKNLNISAHFPHSWDHTKSQIPLEVSESAKSKIVSFLEMVGEYSLYRFLLQSFT